MWSRPRSSRWWHDRPDRDVHVPAVAAPRDRQPDRRRRLHRADAGRDRRRGHHRGRRTRRRDADRERPAARRAVRARRHRRSRRHRHLPGGAAALDHELRAELPPGDRVLRRGPAVAIHAGSPGRSPAVAVVGADRPHRRGVPGRRRGVGHDRSPTSRCSSTSPTSPHRPPSCGPGPMSTSTRHCHRPMWCPPIPPRSSPPPRPASPPTPTWPTPGSSARGSSPRRRPTTPSSSRLSRADGSPGSGSTPARSWQTRPTASRRHRRPGGPTRRSRRPPTCRCTTGGTSTPAPGATSRNWCASSSRRSSTAGSAPVTSTSPIRPRTSTASPAPTATGCCASAVPFGRRWRRCRRPKKTSTTASTSGPSPFPMSSNSNSPPS